MSNLKISSIRSMFLSRLDTLESLIDFGAKHFEANPETVLERRLVSDMLSFGTQVVFACNQPHNFVLWCNGKNPANIDPEIKTISEAKEIITRVKKSLTTLSIESSNFAVSKFEEIITLELGGDMYLELSGTEYLDDFLIPNLYFHLVTAYGILRMNGVQIGKHEYMRHLVPKVQQRQT